MGPIGVRMVSTCLARKNSTGKATLAAGFSRRNGTWPWIGPLSTTGCPAVPASKAMSPPECDAPTTSTPPGFSWDGRL